jgi:undecaprenyl-diphosphatase
VTSTFTPALRGRISTDVARFDRRVDDWFADHLRGRAVADRIFYSASALGDHGTIWLILAAIRGLRSDEGLPAAVRAAAGVGIESALVNGPIKWIFRRQRPVLMEARPLPLRRPRTSSFPSGHATSAFCAAALLSDGDERWAPLYYGLAVVVAWSRVHVRIHHASDVVAGMAIGASLGGLSRRIVRLPRPAPPSSGI